MNGDEVRNVKFGQGVYDMSQVDDLLHRIAAELDAERPAGPLIANARFRTRLSYRGYDGGAVDWFLEQLRIADHSELARMNADPWRDLAADPYYIHREPGDPAGRICTPAKQEYEDAWRDFGQQPGTRLSWVRVGAGRRELRTEARQTVASFRRGAFPPGTFSAGGRTFTERWLTTKSEWPRIAETISSDRLGRPPHELKSRADDRDPLPTSQLADEMGIPVLYTGGMQFNRLAYAYIKFPGQRWLRFPVRGTKRDNAIMTAVDQAGNKVARYRLANTDSRWWKTTEIIVHPGQQLTDELALAIAVSAPLLHSYFSHPSSGGGG